MTDVQAVTRGPGSDKWSRQWQEVQSVTEVQAVARGPVSDRGPVRGPVSGKRSRQ